MSDANRSEIIYEEGWLTPAPPAEDPPSPEEPSAPASGDDRSKPLLISIQLILCAVAALVLFLLKAMDSPAYHSFMTWYRVEMSRPVISQEFFDSFRVSSLASADEVTVRASADELLPR